MISPTKNLEELCREAAIQYLNTYGPVLGMSHVATADLISDVFLHKELLMDIFGENFSYNSDIDH